MKKRISVWYVEPLDSHTNEVVAKSPGIVEAEHRHDGKLCADGKLHNLWQYPSGLLFMLIRSRTQMKTKFRVWSQEGNGKIYNKTRWIFRTERPSAKKRRKSA